LESKRTVTPRLDVCVGADFVTCVVPPKTGGATEPRIKWDHGIRAEMSAEQNKSNSVVSTPSTMTGLEAHESSGVVGAQLLAGRRRRTGCHEAVGDQPYSNPSIDTLAVVISVGHRISVRPVATATFCVPLTE
jgi:hypothetical protein